MAQSTPLRLLANLDAVTFRFPVAPAVDVVINFYDGAGVLLAPGADTLDITAARPVESFSGAVSAGLNLPAIEVQPAIPTLTLAANVPATLALGGVGSNVLKLTPSAPVTASGVSYTIKVITAQTRAPEPVT